MVASGKNDPIEDFDYHLPPELVAQQPLPQRDRSRLLVLHRATGEISHAHFRDLANWLDPDDLLVVNDTRVFPARLHGIRRAAAGWSCSCTTCPTRRPRRRRWPGPGPPTGAGCGPDKCSVSAPNCGRPSFPCPRPGWRRWSFPRPPATWCRGAGPGRGAPAPYIQRPAGESDRENYQTVFAQRTGAVACPTAGLHFTGGVLQDLADKGIETVTLTLHVGPGTFLPVRHSDYTQHQMLPEYFELSEAAAARLNEAKARGRRIVAVGTTSTRVLEHCASPEGFAAQQGWCGLYLYPGYQFKAVDRLITNFHLPKSTLLLLVSALAGRDLILRAYAEAVKEKYRFFSYGDCMLIL